MFKPILGMMFPVVRNLVPPSVASMLMITSQSNVAVGDPAITLNRKRRRRGIRILLDVTHIALLTLHWSERKSCDHMNCKGGREM